METLNLTREVQRTIDDFCYRTYPKKHEQVLELQEYVARNTTDGKYKGSHWMYRQAEKSVRIYELLMKAGLTAEECLAYWEAKRLSWTANREELRKKPVQERKDNKDQVNWGSGHSWPGKVRLPRKTASKRTWAKFYKLFPRLDPDRSTWAESARPKTKK